MMNPRRHTLPIDPNRVWLITGSSSGFGRALAEAILDRGERAVATARRPQQAVDLIERYPAQAQLLELDVTRPDQVNDVVAQAMDHFGRIDVLVNNAGFGLVGAVEELDFSQLRRVFETNFFGLVSMTRAVLPVMRRARRGHIINMSSVAGVRARPGVGGYSASKFAVEGLSEALAEEVAPLGIRVTIIEPGVFRTDFAGRSLDVAAHPIDDYAATAGATLAWNRAIDGHQDGDPARAAAAIFEVVDSEHPPLRLALGVDSLTRIREKLASMRAELAAWEPVSDRTAFRMPGEAAASAPQGDPAAMAS